MPTGSGSLSVIWRGVGEELANTKDLFDFHIGQKPRRFKAFYI